MKRLMLVMAFALVVAPAAQAETLMTPVAQVRDSGLMVRVRGVYIAPSDGSDAIPGLNVPGDAIEAEGKLIPEVDFTYLFNEYLAAELILTYPQEHDVELMGTKIGSFSHLPPTLTVQGRLPFGRFTPYVGAGINLTWITDTDLAVPGVGELELEDVSFGFAAQGGLDVALYDRWYANVDVKWVTIRSDVKAGGTKVSEVQVDPWLVGAGVGYRF